MKNRGVRWTVGCVVACAVAAAAGWVASGRAQSPAGAPEPAGPLVARVGKLTVTQAELDARADETLRQLRARTGTGVAPAQQLQLRRQVLEALWGGVAALPKEPLRKSIAFPHIERRSRKKTTDRQQME